MTLEEKVIDAFQLCDAAINQAEKIQQEKRAADAAIASNIPDVVSTLIEKGLIGPEEKSAAEIALRNPVQALTLLKRAAMFVYDAKTNEPVFGEQVDSSGRQAGNTKRASHVLGSESSAYVGARTSSQKPSDLALVRGLGLA